MDDLARLLGEFAEEHDFKEKGALALALVLTRRAREFGLPLDAGALRTKGGGQVKGQTKSAVQKVLADHGISRVLAEEGGRTSRGTVSRAEAYVGFLNTLHDDGRASLEPIEAWWVQRVQDLWTRKPFVLRFDPSKSVRAVVGDLLAQTQRRQEENPGMMFSGAVLQHLVGAKLEFVFLDREIVHHGSSVADAVSGREADFLLGDVAIHVTMSPGEALVRKCQGNLDSGHRPMIITTAEGLVAAGVHLRAAGILERVDLFEVEQFVAGNIYEHGKFGSTGRRVTAEQIVKRYNEIVEQCERDPSLRIEVA